MRSWLPAALLAFMAGLVWWQHLPLERSPLQRHIGPTLAPEQPAYFPPTPLHSPKPAATATPIGKGWHGVRAVPGDYPRRRYESAVDLYGLALEELPAARAGDGASSYLIYLALDECRPLLLLDASSMLEVNERMLGSRSDLEPQERRQWEQRYSRCLGFAINDWSPLGDALGAERPGAVTEYAGAWFQRAVAAGYPPALTEKAFRPGPEDEAQRRALLIEALRSGHPEPPWLLFLHFVSETRPQPNAHALVWLRLACEAGFDCRGDADWFTAMDCLGQSCDPRGRVVAMLWQELDPAQRRHASALLVETRAALSRGEAGALPLPPLPGATR